MNVTRRTILGASATLPLAVSGARAVATPAPLPDTASFAPMRNTYLDSGTMHPIATGARQSADAYLRARDGTGGHYPTDEAEARVKASFARLINCNPAELAFVQSTTAGEQLVIAALDLPRGGGRVVTDTLHFFGSFYLYEQLAKQGVDVAWLRARDGRIAVDDIERAITPGTRLVALSLVSTYNGFEHDLTRVCEIAHAKGALVYADIIHAAGTIPIDVRASGVDFAACASYKWLMGDFGLGFLYARADLHDRIKRSTYGYYQLAGFQPHVYPFDPPGDTIADVTPRSDAEGLFATGTRAHTGIALLDWSLAHLLDLGVERITAYRRPMLARLQAELPRKGYRVVTPPDSRTPLVTCILEGAHDKLAAPLQKAGVQITLSRNRFRFCPSVFNDMDDIDRALAALPAA
ncbi:aminotransferase class V-fold PLP-dependent enzyme [Sphingomonas populi]|uniref:Aminotransferase class V-fold PLP-dependent enzyme n=1 Tax=Sphingomonas populi TaxID=2484750 RepID=A0A4Q6Y6J0_9SPHN|nr:aminotransferase class V-fold PLP-dependent enzyme [Sphingomonas populi]RZF65109.1 aminotransferase class V-fold PLP-dependent enzyme [Sphingomonas populi]